MNAECRMMNAESKTGKRRLIRALFFYSAFSILHSAFAAAPAFAAPSQQDVFQSIQRNVGKPHSSGDAKGLAVLLCAAGGLILVMLVCSRIRRRQSSPQSLHHPGKLLREIMKTVPLKPRELKQLKLLVEESRNDASGSEPVQSPLTLLLCPSVLSRAVKNHPAKIDRAVMAQIVRKMGVTR